LQGASVLGHGDLSVLSFHATKVFNTLEGGAIISPDAETKKRIDEMKNFGFIDELTVDAAGINGKMNEVSAALGLLQLKHVNSFIEGNQAVDSWYRRGLVPVKGIQCMPDFEGSNYSYFPIRVGSDFPISRDALYQRLRDCGFLARRYFYPLVSQFAAYADLSSAAVENHPAARLAAAQIICLPIFPAMQADVVNQIVAVISKPFESPWNPSC
jgi:dTDP-4-amino-4,6-dideoxygalactose transaminase